jgi:hypothetical protein
MIEAAEGFFSGFYLLETECMQNEDISPYALPMLDVFRYGEEIRECFFHLSFVRAL